MRDKTILVTGGAGYIGAHTCKALAEAGYAPVVLDDLSSGHRSFVKWGEFVEGSLFDRELLDKTFAKYKPAAVMNFAASTLVGESLEQPLKYYQNNVGGMMTLLAAMQGAGVQNLVFSSTCAVFGVPNVRAMHEDLPKNPINPYGQSKLMIETILRDMAAQNQIRFAVLRYFNAAGADKDGEIGEEHEPETHLIPLAIRAGLRGEELKIMGTDFPTPDGTGVRDYPHVEDLASAHIAALEYVAAGNPSDFFNLGTGTGYSVHEVVDTLGKLGVEIKTVAAPRRAGDPAWLVADPTKAKKILGWKPEYDTLEKTLVTAVAWHRKHG